MASRPTDELQPKKSPPYKPFDVTSKQLVETDPAAWLDYLGLPLAPVEIIDADLSTIVPEADKLIKVHATNPYLLNIEFQTTYEADLDKRALFYNVVERHRHHLPVKTVIVLFRPEADGERMTGHLQDPVEEGEEDFGLDFRYRVVRVWQEPVERLLTSSLALLPLAPLSDEAQGQLPRVIERMQARIEKETTPQAGRDLWAATFLLMGLRYQSALIEQLLKGVQEMKESTTYQLLISRGEEQGEKRGKEEGKKEGKKEEAINMLLRIGRKRLGEPTAATLKALEGLSVEQIEELGDQLLQVESWSELLPAE